MIAMDAVVGDVATYDPDETTRSEAAQLIRRSQDGDVHAFNQLVERYQKYLYGLCYRLLGHPEDAADTLQETFLAAYRNIRGYRGGSFTSWLVRIATNRCYDLLRARQRRVQISLDRVDHEADEALPQLAAPDHTPEEQVMRGELSRELEQRLQELAPKPRLAIVLSDIQGYNYEEIAAITGWPVGTVKSRLSRARADLRATLRQFA